jgi:hypothetical protein
MDKGTHRNKEKHCFACDCEDISRGGEHVSLRRPALKVEALFSCLAGKSWVEQVLKVNWALRLSFRPLELKAC